MSGPDLPSNAQSSDDEPFTPSKEAGELAAKILIPCLLVGIGSAVYFSEVNSVIGVIATFVVLAAVTASIVWTVRGRDVRRRATANGRPAESPRVRARALAVGGLGITLGVATVVLEMTQPHGTLLGGITGIGGGLCLLWSAATVRSDLQRH